MNINPELRSALISKTNLPKLPRIAKLGLAIALATICSNAALAADRTSEAGQKQFLDYCAVCHGEAANGGGPLGNALSKAPPDLTALAKNNGGTFPFMKVYDSIDGRELPNAHGARDMPVWGGSWKQGSTLGSETALRGRILELIIYLKSIQQ